jgi:hypothetical protein
VRFRYARPLTLVTDRVLSVPQPTSASIPPVSVRSSAYVSGKIACGMPPAAHS